MSLPLDTSIPFLKECKGKSGHLKFRLYSVYYTTLIDAQNIYTIHIWPCREVPLMAGMTALGASPFCQLLILMQPVHVNRAAVQLEWEHGGVEQGEKCNSLRQMWVGVHVDQ
jgi:hypothetical protein